MSKLKIVIIINRRKKWICDEIYNDNKINLICGKTKKIICSLNDGSSNGEIQEISRKSLIHCKMLVRIVKKSRMYRGIHQIKYRSILKAKRKIQKAMSLLLACGIIYTV